VESQHREEMPTQGPVLSTDRDYSSFIEDTRYTPAGTAVMNPTILNVRQAVLNEEPTGLMANGGLSTYANVSVAEMEKPYLSGRSISRNSSPKEPRHSKPESRNTSIVETDREFIISSNRFKE